LLSSSKGSFFSPFLCLPSTISSFSFLYNVSFSPSPPCFYLTKTPLNSLSPFFFVFHFFFILIFLHHLSIPFSAFFFISSTISFLFLMLFFLSSIPNFFSNSFYSSRTSLPLRSLQQKFSSTYISYLLFIQRLFIIFFIYFLFFIQQIPSFHAS